MKINQFMWLEGQASRAARWLHGQARGKGRWRRGHGPLCFWRLLYNHICFVLSEYESRVLETSQFGRCGDVSLAVCLIPQCVIPHGPMRVHVWCFGVFILSALCLLMFFVLFVGRCCRVRYYCLVVVDFIIYAVVGDEAQFSTVVCYAAKA